MRYKSNKPLADFCVADSQTQSAEETVAVTSSGLIPMRISPLSQHGLNLQKHAAEVSIDYCTSCMNGWERHNLSTCFARISELSGARINDVADVLQSCRGGYLVVLNARQEAFVAEFVSLAVTVFATSS